MNPLNYCTREAAQKLLDAGIVLETEVSWYQSWPSDWELRITKPHTERIPAPSMAEVWREFTDEELVDVYIKRVPFSHDTLVTKAIPHFDSSGEVEKTTFERKQNQNPTDALIDLLIWARKEKAYEV